jgi:hypothetical protein
MKILPKLLLVVLAVILSTSSCTKQNNIDVMPDDSNLTACPVNAQCQSLFTENADMKEQNMVPLAGQYRLFWDVYEREGFATRIFVKAPMARNSFNLEAKDILVGRVLVIQSCISCSMVAFKPIAGYVKGINFEPAKRADQSRWLLEAQIIRQAVNYPNLKDTLYFKRYFYPNFIYN